MLEKPKVDVNVNGSNVDISINDNQTAVDTSHVVASVTSVVFGWGSNGNGSQSEDGGNGELHGCGWEFMREGDVDVKKK